MNTLFSAICFLAFASLYFVSSAVNSDVQKYIDLQKKNCNNKTTEFIKCKKASSFGYNTQEVLENCKHEQSLTLDNPDFKTLCKQLKKKKMGFIMRLPGINEDYFNCIYNQIDQQTHNASEAIENSRQIIERCSQVQASPVEDDSM